MALPGRYRVRPSRKREGGQQYPVSATENWHLAVDRFVFDAATLCAAETDFDTKAYLQNHCIRCHGVDEQNADRRFDTLGAELSDHQTAEHWQEILDIVNLGEMPPEDEPQPSADETKRFVAAVTRQLELARDVPCVWRPRTIPAA